MGYYSEVAITTTDKGWEKIEKLAKQYYKEMLNAKIKEHGSSVWDDCIVCDGIAYPKELDVKFSVKSKDGYTLAYVSDVKWLDYPDWIQVRAYRKAFNDCGEYVRELMVGEDGAIDEYPYNEHKEPGDIPHIWVHAYIDIDAF